MQLGYAQSLYNNNEDAIEAFENAKACGHPTWRSSVELAKAYAVNDKLQAAEELELAVESLRSEYKTDDSKKTELIRVLKLAMNWRIELKQPEKATMLFMEMIQYDTQEHESASKLLFFLAETETVSEILNFLNQMEQQQQQQQQQQQPLEGKKLTQLARMLLFTSVGKFDWFEPIMFAIRDTPNFSNVLQHMQMASDYAEGDKNVVALAKLLFYHGKVLAHHRRDNVDVALQLWEKALSQAMSSSDEGLVEDIGACIVTHYINKTYSARDAGSNSESHLKALEQLTAKLPDSWMQEKIGLVGMASYYVAIKMPKAARSILSNAMKGYISLLSDEIPENDEWAYLHISNCCMRTGDDSNALSALYLMAYPPSSDNMKGYVSEDNSLQSEDKAPGSLSWSCDGTCGNDEMYSDFWVCTVCPCQLSFEPSCFEKLKKGLLRKFVCSPDHHFIYVPSWQDEYRKVKPGKVAVGGHIVDGQRVDGEVVTVDKWLEDLKEVWKIDDMPMKKPEDLDQILGKLEHDDTN
jgi:tetratricopeptide (TPR) repeat protein